ncbi:pleckstrin homology domain-containing family F member 2 [Petromyzon marinus]|uniref:pleckstrin homology domain-containing family F member 2 n=1 Tax=Petromyzon marinus TaxID=7757 RepID=UPI003F71B8F0
MAEPLASSEENCRRIARIESCFGAAGRPLMAPGRVLVGEGTLTKLCRKGPKPRQFFLFDDMVVYGAAVLGNRRYANQRVLALEAVTICTLPDEGELSNGWLMQTPAKSFKVFAATESERAEWIGHIERCVRELRAKRGLPPLPAPCNSPGPGGAGASSAAAASPADGLEPAAWWVPDSSASACMRCQRSRFNALNRRHHCRKCGIVVCGACSDRRFLLPGQSSRPLRVCIDCFDSLAAAAAAAAVTAPAGPLSSSSSDDLVGRVAKVTVANGNRGSSGAAEEARPAVSRGRRGDSSRTSNGTQDSDEDDDDDDDGGDGGDGGRGGGSGEDWADRSPIGNHTGFYS